MSTQQKSAWYVLIVGLLTLVTYVALLVLVNAAVATAAFAVVALTSLVPWLYHDETVDERERHIAHRAGLVGGVAAYLYMIAVCMVVWGVRFRADPPLVDVNILPVIAMGACVILMIARSATVLLLHRGTLDLGAT